MTTRLSTVGVSYIANKAILFDIITANHIAILFDITVNHIIAILFEIITANHHVN